MMIRSAMVNYDSVKLYALKFRNSFKMVRVICEWEEIRKIESAVAESRSVIKVSISSNTTPRRRGWL